MTAEEAILMLDRIMYDEDNHGINWATGAKEAFNMAISALEKQIPKKPIHINKNKEFDGNWKKICPACGSTLIERITTPEESFPQYYNYTSHCKCGQSIDWEED